MLRLLVPRYMLALILASLAVPCGAEFAYSPSASLTDSWRREFGLSVDRLDFHTPPIPMSGSPLGIVLHGGDSEWRNGLDDVLLSSGNDVTEWGRAFPRPLRYIEMDGQSLPSLDSIPEDVRAEVTHVNITSFGELVTAAELASIRSSFPNLCGLGFLLPEAFTIPGESASRDVLVELAKFTQLTELRLWFVSEQVAKEVEALRTLFGQLNKLVRLDLGYGHVSFWDAEFTGLLLNLEWLNLIGCTVPAEAFWESISKLSKLRCLGLSDPGQCGWSATRLAELEKLGHLEALALTGKDYVNGQAVCEALNKLTRLRHLTVPHLRVEPAGVFLNPLGLTKLRSLNLHWFDATSAPWVAAQSELVELAVYVDSSTWHDVKGVFAELAACKKLQTLHIDMNEPPASAFDGLRALPITTLGLTRAWPASTEPGLVKLLQACSALEALIIEPRVHSDELWSAIVGLSKLRTLACHLPDTALVRRLVGASPKLEVFCDLGFRRSSEQVTALSAAENLKILVMPGLTDELSNAIKKAKPGVLVLRDLN
jgi:hypothetical protein